MLELFLWILAMVTLYLLKNRLAFTMAKLLVGLPMRTAIYLRLYGIFFYPGIVIHELSHFFSASFLGVRTGKIDLLPFGKLDSEQGKQRYSMGYVEVERTDFIRSFLIGTAPFWVGNLVLLAIGLVLTQQLGLDQTGASFLERLSMFSSLSLTWQHWGLLYLALSTSVTMFSSKEDLGSLAVVVVFAAIGLIMILVSGRTEWLIALPSWLSSWLQPLVIFSWLAVLLVSSVLLILEGLRIGITSLSRP